MSERSDALQPHPVVVTFGETMGLVMSASSKGIEYSQSLDTSFGGAESNVAIGLSRLGVSSGWFGRLGNDPFGRKVVKTIRGEGVDVSRAVLTDDAPTGMMLREKVAGKTSVYYYRRYSAMSMMKPENLDPAYIAKAQLLHITGITPALSESGKRTVQEAVKIARNNGVKICFDPNLRLKLWSPDEAREALLPLAEQADYFLPGLDELKILFQTDNEEEIFGRLKEQRYVSVVKGGSNETYLVENGEVHAVPYYKVDHVVDTVGAGDGFCAGFIAGAVKGWSHLEAVKLGNLIGSLVIQMEGDWEGLPTWAEIEAILQQKKHVER